MKPLWILYVQTLWLSYYLPITTEPSISANFNSPTSRQEQTCRAFFILPSNTSTDSHSGLLQVWSVVKYCSVHKKLWTCSIFGIFFLHVYIAIMFKDNLRPKIMYTYVCILNWCLPIGAFQGQITKHSNKLNKLRIPTGRRQTSWLSTSAAEELNQGLPGTNPAGGQGRNRTQDLLISSPVP